MALKMLIVDDDTDILNMLSEAMKRKGFVCRTASSGETAMALIEIETFDIILTDMVMHGMGGLEVIKKTRKLNPRTKLIAMTGFTTDVDYEETMKAGANDFIKKPFTVEELVARIKIVQIQDELRALAITDELTGLYNRRGFFTVSGHLLKLARRKKSGVCLLYADLDDLKKINDKYGHAEGDETLKAFAELLRNGYRESDVIARMGGDEFVVFPVGDNDHQVNVIITRLQNMVAEFNASRKLKFPISVSHGVASFNPDDPCSIAELVTAADQEMYRNKTATKTETK